MPESQVLMSVQDLVSLMAKEVAREVTDKLRETEIEPMRREITQLKESISNLETSHKAQETKNNTMLDTIWKFGIVLTTSVATIYYICEMIWHH